MIYRIDSPGSNTFRPQVFANDGRRATASEKPERDVVVTADHGLFKFSSVDDFSFAVDSRTSVSTSLFQSVVDSSTEELRHLAKSLKAEEKSFIKILEDALLQPSSIRHALEMIPLERFRNDYHWQEIIASLLEQESVDPYLRTALVKYVQFLASLQEIVRLTFALRTDGREGDANTFGTGRVEQSPHETALFDALQFNDAGRMINPYRRLPRGEAVTLYTLPGHPIALLLAKYSFELVNQNGWFLIDSMSKKHRLSRDLNYVGRGRENDVALNSDYRNVSRKHVIIHPLDDQSVVLIDLSSHGTFVPPRQVDFAAAQFSDSTLS